MKHTTSVPGEYYHVYNRGVDKRTVFQDKKDLSVFLAHIQKLNTQKTLGGLRKLQFKGRGSTSYSKLVEIVAFCLNPNHFHMILTPVVEGGIEKFMQKVGTGYTMYFNDKYDRSGSLFQGRYKVKHIATNEYLLYLGSYVNLNYMVHGLGEGDLYVSSWNEYVSHETGKRLVNSDILLGQYKDKEDYRENALALAQAIAQQRLEDKSLEKLLME